MTKEEDEEVFWCTECPYFKYVADDMDDDWYGARCYKDGHEANPSMFAVQSLHDDCPLKKVRIRNDTFQYQDNTSSGI